jgi:phosphatidylserine/phosphatidylglycerophosphate/cardiolipin synthase-like enzyme
MRRLVIALILAVVLGCTVVPCQAYSTDKAQEAVWYTVQPAQLSVYFPTNGGDPAPVLVNLYNSANNTIDIAIYSLTNPRIIDAITKAKQRGIKVRVIADRMESKSQYMSAALRELSGNGIPVLINTHAGLMHMKMSTVDKTFVTIGSYNYTMDASQTNDEVFLVCTEPLTIQACQDQFNKMWADNKAFEKY